MEEALRTWLLADAATRAIVGTGAAARAHWNRRPQEGALPALVLNTISGPRTAHTDGPDGVGMDRVQIRCLAATYAQALALARAVEARLHGQALRLAAPPLVTAQLADRRGLEASEDPETITGVSLDFLVWHRL